MIFWKPKQSSSPKDAAARLRQAVRQYLPNADDASVRTAAAVAGLLVGVAYADREYSEAEQAHVRQVLSRVRGLEPDGVEAIFRVLQESSVEVATVHTHAFTRELKQLTDRESRVEILDLLVDLAAADETISGAETVFLRQVATSMGLTQADYNASQQRYRDKLSVLQKP